jgi:hypothetical protein
MYRPLALVATAAAAFVLLSACGGGSSPATDAANPTATPSATVPAHASGSPAAGGGTGGTGGSSGTGHTGSGTTKPVGAATTVPKPCSVVTAADVTAALHASGTVSTTTDTADDCTYTAANGDSVDIEVQSVPYTPDLPNAISEIAPAGQVKTINGLGDAAVLFTPMINESQLYLWKHGLAVTIDVERSGFAPAGPAAQSLGTTAAGRI